MIHLLPPKIICVICLLYLSGSESLLGQNEETQGMPEHDTGSYVTANVLSPLNGWGARWRFGYIQDVDERWKFGLDLGYGDGNISFFEGNKYQLWEARPELYYFLRTKGSTGKYFSLEPFYIHHTDIFFDRHYVPVNGETTRYDSANYERQKYGLNLKFGFLFNVKGRFGINLYTGAGIRIRKNTFTNVENPRVVDVGPEGGDFLGLEAFKNLEGTYVAPNFALGLKIFYRLNN